MIGAAWLMVLAIASSSPTSGPAQTHPPSTAPTTCPDLSTGRIQPAVGATSVDVAAPPGWLIDEVCTISVGAQTPIESPVDPLAESVTVRTPDGARIAEYSVSFVVDSTAMVATSSPQPATIDAPQAASIPASVHAGARASSPPFTPLALAVTSCIGIALLGIAAATLRPSRRRGQTR